MGTVFQFSLTDLKWIYVWAQVSTEGTLYTGVIQTIDRMQCLSSGNMTIGYTDCRQMTSVVVWETKRNQKVRGWTKLVEQNNYTYGTL